VGVFKVQEASGGPPAGADLQITLLGEDLTILDDYANKIIGFLKTQSGVTNVDKSIKPGTSKMIFTPEKDKLTEVNLSMDSLALWLRTYASGFTLDTIKEGRDNKDIIFQIVSNQSPEDLGQLSVQTEKGLLPLLSLGKLSLTSNPTIITRDSKKRSISVSASVSEGNNIADKNKFLEVFVKDKLNLASGYTWKTGGVNEENQKSVNSILQAMLISFLLILITMVVEFKSYRQTFIALALIPLSIAGVFYIFALSQTPLSFPALIGILALFGIVVTHAIVVIEKINENLKEGLELKDAIVDAAGNRLEPVLLTSLATIFGLVPITLSDPLWRGLGGAIIAGLVFSGAIKLFFVPVAYYLVYKK
jgi:HAE1 family hydrophobic/amphiphilic exporter-1